jgi:thiosulfate dehydrogenase
VNRIVASAMKAPRFVVIASLLVLCALATQSTPAVPAGEARDALFQPPAESSISDDEFGKFVKLGQHIFLRPGQYAAAYVGNGLHCDSCHLDAGRLAGAAPMWGAYVAYPRYREKNHRVMSFQERLQDCFRFSMNGKAPPLGDPVLIALESYSYWLAKGAPTGVKLKGAGYLELPKPAEIPNYARGERVYQQNCSMCHGGDGAGLTANGESVFPALWGADSFNWGAGMHLINVAAGFIKANMPLGRGGTLSDQDAWDVAMYVDSHERPQDPRFTGSIAETRSKYHDSPESMYGQIHNGVLLGAGVTPARASDSP